MLDIFWNEHLFWETAAQPMPKIERIRDGFICDCHVCDNFGG